LPHPELVEGKQRVGKSGQHRATHPANGRTSLKKERDSATENNYSFFGKRKGENVR